MADELRKPIKWDRPCYKCGSHYCDLSCPDRANNANAAPQDQDAKDAADIFWDYEDGEYCVRSIQEICENACDRGAENGAVLRVNQAKSLPHIFLRLIVPENPDESVDYITISESEAIAAMQQEQKP